MKSMLLSAVAMPALLAVGAATAFAQTTPPPPASPSPSAPAENMPSTTPAPSPEPSTATPTPAPDKSADAATSAGTFASTQTADEWRSSKLVGLTVYNQADEKVGDISDLVLGPDGKISNAVIGVGGFLGLGEKLVAVAFSDLQLNRDADGTMRVTINSSKEALDSAPDYKYNTDAKMAQ